MYSVVHRRVCSLLIYLQCRKTRTAKMLLSSPADGDDKDFDAAGIAQLVEHQPSKLRVAGSRPVSRSIRKHKYCMDVHVDGAIFQECCGAGLCVELLDVMSPM